MVERERRHEPEARRVGSKAAGDDPFGAAKRRTVMRDVPNKPMVATAPLHATSTRLAHGGGTSASRRAV